VVAERSEDVAVRLDVGIAGQRALDHNAEADGQDQLPLHLTGTPAQLASKAHGSFARAIHAGGPSVSPPAPPSSTGSTPAGRTPPAALLAAISVSALLAGDLHSGRAGSRQPPTTSTAQTQRKAISASDAV
jgi:hypothetical protein